MSRRLILSVLMLAVSIVLLVFYVSVLAQLDPPTSAAPPALPTCTEAEISAALAALPDYQPAMTNSFVGISNGQFALDDDIFFAKGVNYYPSRYPWRRFLTESDLTTIEHEFTLLQSVNLNTLRIFLWNEALFTCPGSGTVPIAENFRRLDGIIHLAAEHGFRLIITLNDLADLEAYPLYDNPAHIQAQTEFIVSRYRDEAAILAWDLRNEGDIDYGTLNTIPASATREAVLTWLGETAALVRSLDSNHLVTAGWLYDNEATIPHVDFVSFHHWVGEAEAYTRILELQAATDKPILLQEFGYSTQRMDEASQARTIGEVIDVVEKTHIAGWLIWTAFDFPTDATCIPPNCPSPDNAEHHFGLWHVDYSPKPVVQLLINRP